MVIDVSLLEKRLEKKRLHYQQSKKDNKVFNKRECKHCKINFITNTHNQIFGSVICRLKFISEKKVKEKIAFENSSF